MHPATTTLPIATAPPPAWTDGLLTRSRLLTAYTVCAIYLYRSWTRGMLCWRSTSTLQRNGRSLNTPRSSPQATPSTQIRNLRCELLGTHDSLFSRTWELLSRGGRRPWQALPDRHQWGRPLLSPELNFSSWRECLWGWAWKALHHPRRDSCRWDPMIARLERIYFSENSSFVGTPRLEFESHLAVLTSILPQDF